MTNQATPRPWKSIGRDIETVTGDPVASTYGLNDSEEKANAKIIVKAVNCHDELVEALNGMIQHFQDVDEYTKPHAYKRFQMAKLALSKAQEE